MTYELQFVPDALDEWHNLDQGVKAQFKKKLAEVLENPIRPRARLSGMRDCYKIKQRGSGFRLIYQVDQGNIIVLVLSIGKRERNRVYKQAQKRIKDNK